MGRWSFLESRPRDSEARQSRNLAWACRRAAKELLRLSSSEESCFCSWESCGTERSDSLTFVAELLVSNEVDRRGVMVRYLFVGQVS